MIALVHRRFFSLCAQTHNTLLVREAHDYRIGTVPQSSMLSG